MENSKTKVAASRSKNLFEEEKWGEKRSKGKNSVIHVSSLQLVMEGQEIKKFASFLRDMTIVDMKVAET